jgi:hypothetical protein
MCPLWREFSCELQWMYVYKDLQQKTHTPSPFEKYTPSAQIKQTLYTQPGVTYTKVTKQNSYTPTNTEPEPYIK